MISYCYSLFRLWTREGFRVPLNWPPGIKGLGNQVLGIHGKGFPPLGHFLRAGGRKKRGLFPRLFAGLHLVHVVVNILEDIDPAGPEFIEKKPFPLGRQEFFQQDVAGSQVGGDDDFPHLIDFRGQGFQLHRRSLLKKHSMGRDGSNPYSSNIKQ